MISNKYYSEEQQEKDKVQLLQAQERKCTISCICLTDFRTHL